MKLVSVKKMYPEEYIRDRDIVLRALKKHARRLFSKDFEEIYDHAYSLGEEYGRESGKTSSIVKITINLFTMTNLSAEDISRIVNAEGDKKISQHLIYIKDCFRNNDEQNHIIL